MSREVLIDLIKTKTIVCPKRYDAYDQRNDDCKICGEAKLYQADRHEQFPHNNEGACAGWVHPLHGPLSCISYAKIKREELLNG